MMAQIFGFDHFLSGVAHDVHVHSHFQYAVCRQELDQLF